MHPSTPSIPAIPATWSGRDSRPSYPTFRDSRESFRESVHVPLRDSRHPNDRTPSFGVLGIDRREAISPFAPTEPDWDPATALADILGEGKRARTAAADDEAGRRIRAEDFATAALLAQPFVIAFTVLRFRAPPTAAQWAHADPVLGLLPRDPTLWLLPLFGVALAIAWLAFAWPSWAVLRRALLGGLFGAAAVGVAAAAWWHFKGPLLPTSVRLETAPAQGLCLGIGAGVLEALLVPTIVLPIVYLHFADRSRTLATVVGVLVAGAAFAALHDTSALAWASPSFLLRTFAPGVAIALLGLLTRPAFAVVGLATFHLLAPLCFV